jgi:hypothetical protein
MTATGVDRPCRVVEGRGSMRSMAIPAAFVLLMSAVSSTAVADSYAPFMS